MDSHERAVLSRYGRFLAHMRTELEDRRFGLMLGAGVSIPLGFPSWAALVDRIARHPEVDGAHVISGAGQELPETSKTQILFQHYRARKLEAARDPRGAKQERLVQGRWRRIIHESLYRDVPPTASALRDAHPYLRCFIDVIADSEMTVNYNFDDTIQQLLLDRAPAQGTDSVRSFETVWNAYLPFRSNTSILYHPNGFLPRNLLEYPSETLVLSDDSFADQLLASMAGHHASLLHHLSKKTCLLIGLSLQDATLRHLLRQSAVINPGHYHYLVHWLPRGTELDPSIEGALRDANFEVYNLVTLCLDDDGIAALGRLLTLPEPDLRREADELGVDLKYFHYLTGAIGAGKTTCLSFFGSFKSYEEWAEARLEELAKPWRDLDESEKERVDEWIVRQFDLKNCKLLDQRIGIHVVDRTPLDPLAFTETGDIINKAGAIVRGLSPGESNRRAQPGQVILLKGDPDDMEARVIGRHKRSDAQLIREMQDKLSYVLDGRPVRIVDTHGLSVADVVKEVAKIILLEEYEPISLSDLLEELAGRPEL